MHSKMKWFKWFVLAFAAGFLLPHTYGSLLLASVLDTKSTYDGMTMTDAIRTYHVANTVIVDEFFLRPLLDPDFATLGYVKYPDPETGCEKNVSTYCLALALDENLVQFEIYLRKSQDALDFGTAEEGSEQPLSLNDALQEATSQRTVVDQQILLAEESIDLTLAVYNQVQLVYPVHSEMLKLIGNLDDYRGNLGEIRDIVEKYPSKFNGASTAQCQ